jgi:hypothetical protein
MTNSSVIISFDVGQKHVPIDQIPSIDAPIYAVLSELHRESPPPPALTALSERVSDLKESMELLEHANQCAGRDQLLSFLATSMLAGLVAGTVLGFIANPMIGTGVLVLTLSSRLYCHIKATRLAQHEKRNTENYLSMYPAGVLASPFFLSHLLQTRVSSLQNQTDSCRKDIQSHADEAFPYWSRNGQKLTGKINAAEKRAEESLSVVEKLPIRSLQGEKDLAAYKDLLSRTRIEIEKGMQIVQDSET